ncbi:MAG: hypothetical protein Q8927_09195 [Bacteroidota bacterium]|nr:hypothetical protein [Bacteroidota bacterium]MDP4216365.1 hypothetical protein [Bacteroidota bacterium]MDP4247895.1 hypothetical protein [Bacteroidota bacterium]MDP4255713.1 hypothetical protein [Bacteroidota bacterium]MDP4257460.1 hypothetical protein [Bacteroidota bacterium]
MKYRCALLSPLLILCLSANAQGIFSRFDSTLKIGKAGYRFHCRNERMDQNPLMIRPLGFDASLREMDFNIKGLVKGVEVDDLNNDGFPDLLLYIYTDTITWNGTIYAFVSDGNKSVVPCVLPDAMMDGKINTGYKGHDQFSRMEGYLLQKFPIYQPGDDKDKPSGGTRVLLYQLVRNAEGGFKFNRVRYYDTH